jgi:hypothetical protein
LDTHAEEYLQNPTANPDFTFLHGPDSNWTSVVSIAEVKADFEQGSSHLEAIGHLFDHFYKVFKRQPRRKFIVGLVLSAMSIELWSSTKNMDPKRSGRLSFNPATCEGEALPYLCGVISASADLFGFCNSEEKPSISQLDYTDSVVLCARLREDDAVVLRVNYNRSPAVLKYAKPGDLDREIAALKTLQQNHMSNVPKLLKSGTCQVNIDNTM